MVTNRIAGHVASQESTGTGGRKEPPLVPLRDSVRGKCHFHIVRIRKGVYQIRVGRSSDAVVNFRYQPDRMDDCGYSVAWKRLRTALATKGGPAVQFELEHPEWAEAAMNLASLVGACINSWRQATGRSDFPPADMIARSIYLPEPVVSVALEEYRQAAD